MPNLILNKTNITYEVKLDKRRKTILLTLRDHCVMITTPGKLSKNQVIKILHAKAEWILKMMNTAKIPASKPKLSAGTKIPYLGSYKTLQFKTITSQNTLIVTKESFILTQTFPLNDTAVRFILRHWYVDTACKILTEKTNFWGEKIGAYPSRIMIKEQKTRWGSCSSLRNINYNWRIIMAPENIIDYLVVHELCHLHHMNHSANFWQLVQTYIPHYRECRNWLKTNGPKLTLG